MNVEVRTLQEYLGNGAIGDLIEQFNMRTPPSLMPMTSSEVTWVSKSSHDIVMCESISSDISAMDIDSVDTSAQHADAEDQEEHPVLVVPYR